MLHDGTREVIDSHKSIDPALQGMTKTKLKKLVLKTQTVVPLTANQLAVVAGATGAPFQRSISGFK